MRRLFDQHGNLTDEGRKIDYDIETAINSIISEYKDIDHRDLQLIILMAANYAAVKKLVMRDKK